MELCEQYSSWVTPWQGLAGFLVSPGKGIFWFAPVIIAGLCCWPGFHRRYRRLSILLIVMILARVGALVCRSDWHGGFCLGPRHLLPVIPFFLIPIGCYLARLFRGETNVSRWRLTGMLLFVWVCVSQQIYFCIGEPVSFYYYVKHFFLQQGVSILAGNRIYFEWGLSPLFYLLEAKRGPFLLQTIPLNNYTLWAIASVAVGIMLAVWGRCLMVRLPANRYSQLRGKH